MDELKLRTLPVSNYVSRILINDWSVVIPSVSATKYSVITYNSGKIAGPMNKLNKNETLFKHDSFLFYL
jgi:hypothetical protein